MTQQLFVSAGDHGAGIAKQGLHAMTSGRSLPFVPVEMTNVEEDLRDLLLGRSIAIPVDRLQHLAQPRTLLPRQARVGRDGAAMQSRKELMNGLDPVEAVQAKRNDRDLRRPLLGIVDDLEALTVSEHVAECRPALVVRGLIAAGPERGVR